MNEEFQEIREVVRVRTSAFATKRGLAVRRDVEIMRRLSDRHACLLSEDINATSGADTAKRIINLGEVEDGLYEVTMCGVRRDYETGEIDDYDLELVPWSGKATVSARGNPDNLPVLPKLMGEPR